MRTTHVAPGGSVVMNLTATYPRRRQQREDMVADIRLVVSTFHEHHMIAPYRIVEDRLVEPVVGGRLDDRVHAMLASAMRGSHGVGPDDVLFLSRRIALFAFSALLSGYTEQRAYYCRLEVEVGVLTRELPEIEGTLELEPIIERLLGLELGRGGGFGGVPASDEAIEAVQATKYGSARAEDDDGHGDGRLRVRETSCVVCMEDFMDGQELRVMPCSHAFHKECLDPWLKSSHVCPLCRFRLPTQETTLPTQETTSLTPPQQQQP